MCIFDYRTRHTTEPSALCPILYLPDLSGVCTGSEPHFYKRGLSVPSERCSS